jgi:hypothetical protein
LKLGEREEKKRKAKDAIVSSICQSDAPGPAWNGVMPRRVCLSIELRLTRANCVSAALLYHRQPITIH